ncbi:MAG: heme ABC exporter ATP-binding protein CcmA [Pseudomonadota bacterium]
MELLIDNLCARRGGRSVFDDLSLRVPAGRALLVTGPNGAGKSTLLRVIAGFLPPATGRVALIDRGETLSGAALQPRLAFAGHMDAVKPALSVAENLALWAGIAGRDRDAIEPALSALGLEAMAGRPAGECSAGQRRRLGLARLLVAERSVWLMDEPTSSLDAGSAAAVSALVARHCDAGGIAVIATHLDMGLHDPLRLDLIPERVAPQGGEGALDPAPKPADADEDPFLVGPADGGAFR